MKSSFKFLKFKILYPRLVSRISLHVRTSPSKTALFLSAVWEMRSRFSTYSRSPSFYFSTPLISMCIFCPNLPRRWFVWWVSEPLLYEDLSLEEACATKYKFVILSVPIRVVELVCSLAIRSITSH
jgi:hypothetical protein